MKKYLFIAGTMLFTSAAIAQTCGTTNIAVSKTATASTSNAFNPASLAVDGSNSTAWKSTSVTSQTITIDLSQSYSICKIKLTWAASGSVEAKACTVQISSTDNNWGSVAAAYTETAGNGNDDEFTLSGTGQYVRLTMTTAGATWADHYELSEFEIYSGTSAPPPSSTSGAWNLAGNAGTTSSDFIGTTDITPLVFKTHSTTRMTINSDGQVGINTTNIPLSAMLAVKGEVWAQKVKVTQSGWADYVFDSTYKLLSLPEVENYIRQHKHLPNVPSAKEVGQEGLNLGDNQAVLLRKIEELTLYLIEQNKKLQDQATEIEQLKKQLKRN